MRAVAKVRGSVCVRFAFLVLCMAFSPRTCDCGEPDMKEKVRKCEEVIARAIMDKDPAIRLAGARALGCIGSLSYCLCGAGGQTVREMLTDLCSDPDWAVSSSSALMIIAVGKGWWPPDTGHIQERMMMAHLKSDKIESLRLIRISPKYADVEKLKELVRDKDQEVAALAALTLSELLDLNLAPELEKGLRRTELLVKGACLTGLVKMGYIERMDELMKLISESPPSVGRFCLLGMLPLTPSRAWASHLAYRYVKLVHSGPRELRSSALLLLADSGNLDLLDLVYPWVAGDDQEVAASAAAAFIAIARETYGLSSNLDNSHRQEQVYGEVENLVYALRMRLGNYEQEPEHYLLAFTYYPDCEASRIMSSLGVDLIAARQKFVAILSRKELKTKEMKSVESIMERMVLPPRALDEFVLLVRDPTRCESRLQSDRLSAAFAYPRQFLGVIDSFDFTTGIILAGIAYVEKMEKKGPLMDLGVDLAKVSAKLNEKAQSDRR